MRNQEKWGLSPDDTIRDCGDLLGYPFIGPLLRSPGFINSLQVLTLALFIIAILKGYIHTVSRDNHFTTGLFWGIFWPLFIFLTTPVVGKVICMVCPHRLIIFRIVARFSRRKNPPKWMINGYVSLGLVVIFYWLIVYTWPGIFHNPLNTAIYFTIFTAGAITVSIVYRPHTWCRGLCPVAVPTNIVSRTAFLGIRTYKEVCKSCERHTCVIGRPDFDGCPHLINPSLQRDNSDCTLCMKCVNACSHDAVRFGTVRPLGEFFGKSLRFDLPEALGAVLLLGALTFTMQLYNGIYRGMMREAFPLYRTAIKLEPWTGAAMSVEGTVGLLTFFLSVAVVFGYFMLFSFTAGMMSGRSTSEAFAVMSWSVLPVFALSSLAQMSEFFFFRYYPMIADGFLDLLGLSPGVKPLVYMNSPWLLIFKIISLVGVIWSFIFTWQLSGKLSERVPVRVAISLPFLALYLLILSAFVAHVAVMLLLDIPQITGPRGAGFG